MTTSKSSVPPPPGSAAGVFYFNGAPTIGDVPRGLPDLAVPSFHLAIIPPAFAMALLAASGTLITCLRLDAVTGTRHQPNRELIAQGVGGASSVVSFINVYAGGRTMLAGITASLVVVAAVAFLPLSEIPLSVLAGILVVTAFRTIDWRYLRQLPRIPLGYTAVMLLTVVVAVLVDFTTAILIGLVVSALVDASRSHQRELDRMVSAVLLDIEIWPDADPYGATVGLVILPDRASVASAREVNRILSGDIRDSKALILDFTQTTYIDDTAAALIGQAITGKPVVIVGLNGEPAQMMGGFASLSPAMTVGDLEQAKAVIRGLLPS